MLIRMHLGKGKNRHWDKYDDEDIVPLAMAEQQAFAKRMRRRQMEEEATARKKRGEK